MNHLPAFEDQLGDWLEDGPVDASDRLVDSVLAAFPLIPQRRRSVLGRWTRPRLNEYGRTLAGIVAVAGGPVATSAPLSRFSVSVDVS